MSIHFPQEIKWSQDSIVNVVTSLQAEWSDVRILAGETFLPPEMSRLLKPTQPLIHWTPGLFQGGEVARA